MLAVREGLVDASLVAVGQTVGVSDFCASVTGQTGSWIVGWQAVGPPRSKRKEAARCGCWNMLLLSRCPLRRCSTVVVGEPSVRMRKRTAFFYSFRRLQTWRTIGTPARSDAAPSCCRSTSGDRPPTYRLSRCPSSPPSLMALRRLISSSIWGSGS